LLAEHLVGQAAEELERRLNAAGIPAARVRTLREFTQEAVQTGLLQPVVLGEGEAQAVTPGLGWRTSG
jgi:crotonobetainyl-CoA:carnitine CoA-transferase CaiB-like acyl-CoA transferase